MNLKAVIVFLIVFIVGASLGIIYALSKLGNTNKLLNKVGLGHCTVSLVSRSSVIEATLTDEGKFKDFVYYYLPCEGGKFVMGNPYTKDGPYEASELQVFFTDTEFGNSVYARDDNDERVRVHSNEYNFQNPGKAIIYLQFKKDVMKLGDFENILPFLIAARLHDAKNFENPESWLERGDNLKNFDTNVRDIGLNYEFK